MRTIRTLLARACLRLYPRTWRDRHADELLALVEDADSGTGGLMDLALAGLRLRARELGGGGTMTPRVNSWAAFFAGVTALLVAAPTALFIGLNLFYGPVEWLSGVRLPLGVRLTPGLEWLPALPPVALLIAIAPAVRIGVRRDPSDRTSTLTVRIMAMPRPLIAVIFACAVLVAAVVAYGISENLLEGLRQA
jgi:hypothetical protein